MTPLSHVHPAPMGFETLFKTYYSSLCYFALQYLQSDEQAEDVVQSVFTRWLQESPSVQNEHHARNLLYKMVKHAALNELRRQEFRTYSLEEAGAENEEADDDYFDRVVRAEVYRQILDAIDQLPEACSKVFKLAYVNQMDNEEVAKALSISVNTVKVQKNRAKKKLQLLLKDLYPIFLLSIL